MVRSITTPLSNRICRFPLTVHLGSEAFTFGLCGRRLALGGDRTIDYYWMDSTGFRITRARRRVDPANFRTCVGHWWAAMRACGWDRDPDQVEHLLLAAGYAVVSGSKAVHQVFRDAHLAPRATRPTTAALSDGVRGRVRAAVAGRDRARIGRELDAIFDAPAPPPAEDATVMRQTLDGMLAHGRDLVRECGVEEGVARFIGTLDAWADVKRKKGNQGWLRDFLNRFGYQSKVAFYTCFANAWIDIIPALRRERGLDPVSEQFLRFWHTQQPSAETDVFRGQVLSLHPLSGFLMKDRALMAVAGQFFGTAAHERVFARGEADVPEYWNLVGAILTAGHQYRQALDRHAAGRGVGATLAARGEPATAGDVSPIRELLEDFATSQGVRCPKCKGGVRLDGIPTAAPGADARAMFACPRCRRTVPVVIREVEFRSWSRPPE